MEKAAKLARIGNRILSLIAAVLILLMLLYGGYSLWDNAMVYRGGFVSDELLAAKPMVDENANPSFKKLLAINEDVCAWITIDDTHIDYPVLQGDDDMEYLNKNVYGEYETAGSIFLSSLNRPDFSDNYNLTYGHHMSGGSMYGDVIEFTDKSFFDKHTSGKLLLPDKVYNIELFACVITDGYDNMVFDPAAQSYNMVSFVDYIRAMAVQYRDIGVTANDKIIGLSTCSFATTNERTILYGRLKIENKPYFKER